MLHKQDVFMLNIHTAHGIDGYEVWLHGRNQGRSGVKCLDGAVDNVADSRSL